MSHSLVRRPSTSRPADPVRRSDAARLAALALATTAGFAVVCLVLLYVAGGAFGPVNDWANALLGWWAVLLLTLARSDGGRGPAGDAAVVASALGAAGLTWGSWLVVTGATGWFLAGLVSTLGLAGVGAGLLLARAAARPEGLLTRGRPRLLQAAGWLMTAGVLGLPDALARVDDIGAAGWHAHLGQAGAWLGAYTVLPVWAAGLARDLGRAGSGRLR